MFQVFTLSTTSIGLWVCVSSETGKIMVIVSLTLEIPSRHMAAASPGSPERETRSFVGRARNETEGHRRHMGPPARWPLVLLQVADTADAAHGAVPIKVLATLKSSSTSGRRFPCCPRKRSSSTTTSPNPNEDHDETNNNPSGWFPRALPYQS